MTLSPDSESHLLLSIDPLANLANSYASSHGLLIEKNGTFQVAPMSLLPNVFPSAAFDQARALAPLWNILTDRVSRDELFLQETLGGDVSCADPFTAKLLLMYRKLYCDNPESWANQADRFNIHRGDYMLHPSDDNPTKLILKQIELNTIAASFASLASRMTQLHMFLVARFNCRNFLADNELKVTGFSTSNHRGVPVNPTMEALPHAMKLAMDRYHERFAPPSKCVVLFVVQPGETNTVDQRLLEFELFNQHGIDAIRLSLSECEAQVRVDSGTGALYHSSHEIALVYYRAGYTPIDYPGGLDGAEWKAREYLENSRAIKAPCLGYHLAGTKKIQQALARDGVLERYFETSLHDAKCLRSSFAGLWALGQDANEDDNDAVRRVLHGHQHRFVLKPQREGGGYNFYGDNLLEKLQQLVTVNETDNSITLNRALGEYILMERLFPPVQTSILLRGGKIEGSGETLSELGCYGTILVSHDGETIIHNAYAGYLLRTKFESIDEGGVASGFATLSSPYLV